MVTLSDVLIDQILFEHKDQDVLSNTLNRLGIDPSDTVPWALQLHKLELFNCFAKPDYLELTPFGEQVKREGGWVRRNTKGQARELDYEYEKLLDRRIKELTIKQLKGSIFQLRGWWWIVIISGFISLITSNLELILKLFGVLK